MLRILFRSKLCQFIILSSFLGLTACNGCFNSCKPCPTTDWYQIGYCDGRNGVQKDIDQEQYRCAQYCLEFPINTYYEGWRRGVREFCQPCNGFAIGCSGQNYPCVCPPDLAGPFRAAWYQGIKRYYTPDYCCGDGYCKTYFSPPVNCGCIGQILPFPAGCPCNVVD